MTTSPSPARVPRARLLATVRSWIFAPALVAGATPVAKSESITLVDPPPAQVAGVGALNPSGKSLGWFSGADAALLAEPKADPDFASVQSFTGLTGNAAAGKSYVLSLPGRAGGPAFRLRDQGCDRHRRHAEQPLRHLLRRRRAAPSGRSGRLHRRPRHLPAIQWSQVT